MITVKLKRGSNIPTSEQLSEWELGWSSNLKKLYINDGGTIRIAGGGISLGLNGSPATDEGVFNFYAPTNIAGQSGKLVRLKETIVEGSDPFEYVGVDSTPALLSTNLITSGAVYAGLDLKVDKNGTDRLMTAAEGIKLGAIESGAQVNVIEAIQLDGITVDPASKIVNLVGIELISNKVTSFSSPTNDQYPSAKLVNDQLATKVVKTMTSGTSTSSIDNNGTTFGLQQAITAGLTARIHFNAGKVYLAKYNTGNTPTYNAGTELLNRSEIQAMITGDSSRFITARSGAAGNYTYGPFATKAALDAGPYYYQENVATLSQNDYTYVTNDEDHNDASTMYVFDGNEWSFATIIEERAISPDGTTIELYDDNLKFRIKDLGVSTGKLGNGAVTTGKIADNNVTIAKLVGTVGSGNGRIIGYNSSNVAQIITLNGGANVTTLFAPTTAGTTGQYLRATTGGAPVWVNFPTIPTITLNGATTTTPTFFAPLTGGTSGQMLISNGASAPSWTGTIDGGTW